MHAINQRAEQVWTAVFEEILAKTDLDYVYFWEDMSFKNGPMISPELFREYVAPYYKRLTDFLRARGIKNIFVDTDGDCWLLIPEFLKAGVPGMYPFEVQAGMDITEVRRKHPELLDHRRNRQAKVSEGKAAIDAELDAKMPFMLSQGLFIPTLDHLAHPRFRGKTSGITASVCANTSRNISPGNCCRTPK